MRSLMPERYLDNSNLSYDNSNLSHDTSEAAK